MQGYPDGSSCLVHVLWLLLLEYKKPICSKLGAGLT